jgi:hypothetical protein
MPYLGDYTGAPSQSPSGEKSPFLRDSATPGAFGVQVDEAQQQLGQQIQRSSQVLQNYGDTLQDHYNDGATQNINNQYVQMTAEPTAKFNQLSGQAALDAKDDYVKFLNDTKTQLLASAPNGEVARRAGLQLDRLNTAYQVDAIRHTVSQTYQYSKDQTAAGLKLSQDQGAQDPENLPKFISSLENTKQLAVKQSVLNGNKPDDDATKVYVKQMASGNWTSRLDTLSVNGRADQAMKEYQEHRDEMFDPNDALYTRIDTAQKSQAIDKVATQLTAGDLTTVKNRENYAMRVLEPLVGKTGAAGLVGGMSARESGMIPTKVNEGDGKDGSDSIGVGQWNAARAEALKKFAADRGKDWTDYPTQIDFIAKELREDKPEVLAALKAAKTPEEAATIANNRYEVSADYEGTPGHAQRQAAAARLAKTDTSAVIDPRAPTYVADAAKTARRTVESMFPDSPGIGDQAEQAVRNKLSLVQQDSNRAKLEANYNARDMIYEKTNADPLAKPPTWEELMKDGRFKAQVDTLMQQQDGDVQVKNLRGLVNRQIAAVPDTPERSEAYQTAMGIRADDPARFMKMNLADPNNPLTNDLTAHQMGLLHAEQRKMTATAAKDPNLDAVKRVLVNDNFFAKANMVPSKLGQDNPEYDKFMGALNAQAKIWQSRGSVPKDEEIKSFARMLMTTMGQNRFGFGGQTFYNTPIPDAARDSIVKRYQKEKGYTPTEEQVQTSYRAAFYGEALQNQPAIQEELARRERARAPVTVND